MEKLLKGTEKKKKKNRTTTTTKTPFKFYSSHSTLNLTQLLAVLIYKQQVSVSWFIIYFTHLLIIFCWLWYVKFLEKRYFLFYPIFYNQSLWMIKWIITHWTQRCGTQRTRTSCKLRIMMDINTIYMQTDIISYQTWDVVIPPELSQMCVLCRAMLLSRIGKVW